MVLGSVTISDTMLVDGIIGVGDDLTGDKVGGLVG